MGKWLIASSLILTFVLALAAWDARRQEFRAYQEAYFRTVVANAPDESARQWARDQRVEIKQQYLGALRRLDRCQTCHLGVDDPAFRNGAEPLRTHPPILDSHPPERFGCVSCHGGEGLAVTTLAAHGDGEGQVKRLLKGDYIQAACYSCHGEKTLPPEATAAVVRGQQLMNRNMCLRCHQVRGEGGNEGPDLSTVGSVRDRVWLYAHFINPQAMNLVSTMPRFQLSRDDIKYLTVFLLTLQGGREQVTDIRYIADKPVEDSRNGADPSWRWPASPAGQTVAPSVEGATGPNDAGLVPSFDYDGRDLFRGAGCKDCHTVGQLGGEVGPVLTYIARKYDRDFFVRLLREPASVFPQGVMPQLYLNEKQVQALADYLSTLR